MTNPRILLLLGLVLLWGILARALEPLPISVGAVEDTVDTLEVNHVFTDGRHCLSQVIGWQWDEYAAREQVVFWRLFKSDMKPGTKSMTWYDGETLRRVRYQHFFERWLNYDVEVFERDYLPQDKRRQLTTPRTETTSGASEGDLE